jgi:uncharacterized protein (DUF433 family)
MSGAACFAGVPIPVQTLFGHLEGGYNVEYFLVREPTVSRKQAICVLRQSRRRAKTDAAVVRG